MSDLALVKWFRSPSDAAGPARRALDDSLGSRSLSGLDLVTAEIARGAAELVDSAREAQDARMWLAASARLLSLTAQLRSGPSTAGPGEPSGERPGDAGDDSGDLAGLMGAGPEVGDAAYA